MQVGRRARDVVLPMLAQFRHFPGPTLELGGKQYVLAGHDWRREPPSVMHERFADVELHGKLVDADEVGSSLVVLSEDAFRDAVRAALRDCATPHALANNPLCRSRLVAELPEHLIARRDAGLVEARGAGARDAAIADPDAARLSVALQVAAQTLDEGAKEQKLFQALLHTYLEPAPSCSTSPATSPAGLRRRH